MTYYSKTGSSYTVTKQNAADITSSLPPGNYLIKMDPFQNLYLDKIDNFVLPNKLYGDTTKHTDRILRTFMDRPNATGVLLNGEKGSGKTLLAKSLATKASELGMPTIVINAPWHGDKFNDFIQTIDQPAVILFDEFEKVYEPEQQQDILTLMDGVFPTKKLFVLTVNDKWRVDQHMRNRPGRIYYMLDFKGLDVDFIREYCNDVLVNKDYIESICMISGIFHEFNFDMLKALVEEMNRYNESPQEAMRMLNTKPEFAGANKYDVKLNVKGKDIDHVWPNVWNGNPLSPVGIEVNYDPDPNNADSDSIDINFSTGNLKTINSDDGVFVFANDSGARLTLVKVKEKSWDFYNMAF